LDSDGHIFIGILLPVIQALAALLLPSFVAWRRRRRRRLLLLLLLSQMAAIKKTIATTAPDRTNLPKI